MPRQPRGFDVFVFAALVPRLLGARVLLDLQECMPEFFATKFPGRAGRGVVGVIGLLEQVSVRFAQPPPPSPSCSPTGCGCSAPTTPTR